MGNTKYPLTAHIRFMEVSCIQLLLIISHAENLLSTHFMSCSVTRINLIRQREPGIRKVILSAHQSKKGYKFISENSGA